MHLMNPGHNQLPMENISVANFMDHALAHRASYLKLEPRQAFEEKKVLDPARDKMGIIMQQEALTDPDLAPETQSDHAPIYTDPSVYMDVPEEMRMIYIFCREAA